jgi:two-component system, chemotaxis family, sensor kinase CheA
MDDLLADFIAESREMLEALGGEIVAWEEDPGDRARLDSIFRFVHTVKGNCGFFDFPGLQALSHATEDALADVRAGRRRADSPLVNAVLAIIDRMGDIFNAIEAGADLHEAGDAALVAALEPAADESEIVGRSPAPAGAEAQPPAAAAQRSVRLPVELLDRVMSGVSDMVLARNDLARRIREIPDEAIVKEPFGRLSAIIADVRDAMTRTRMQRVDSLFAVLPRLVRDLSAELGKQVMVDIDGGDVELDREMIEIIRDPLTHIIRNAIDHGIELPSIRLTAGKREIGLLSISARQSGNQILIDVVDDGRGINDERLVEKAMAAGIVEAADAARMSLRERIALIFEPGLSTAEEVTSISGRGVGMDVVRSNVERIGGAIEIESVVGQGTRVTLRVPLTLTIIPALTVSIGEHQFAIPRSCIEEIIEARGGAVDLSHVGGVMLAKVRDRRLPCVVLADILRLDSAVGKADRNLIVLRLAGGETFGLAVDRLHDHEELVVKPVAPAIMATGLYAGTTLTDDGNPILLLEVAGLAQAGGLKIDALERNSRQFEPSGTLAATRARPVLMFVGLDGRRRAMPMAVVERIEEVEIDAVETGPDGMLVVMDGRILPLAGTDGGPLPQTTLSLFRLSDGECEIGYACSEVMDMVQMDGGLIAATQPGEIAGTILIDGMPAELVDPYWLFQRHGSMTRRDSTPLCRIPADDAWMQNFLRPMVEATGYRVVDDSVEADVDLAIVSEALPSAPPRAGRVIRLRSRPDELPEEPHSIYRYDRDGLMRALRAATTGR